MDDAGKLFRLAGENPDEMPQVLAARLADGACVAYFHEGLPESVIVQILALAPDELYNEQAKVLDILGVQGPAWRGRTYFFPESPGPSECSLVLQRGDRFLVEADGVVAAEAWSSRSTDFAAELAVETQPEFRRRGYGRQACAAWARHQLAVGRTAFYSHSIENVASAALAHSLGVMHVFDIVGYA